VKRSGLKVQKLADAQMGINPVYATGWVLVESLPPKRIFFGVKDGSQFLFGLTAFGFKATHHQGIAKQQHKDWDGTLPRTPWGVEAIGHNGPAYAKQDPKPKQHKDQNKGMQLHLYLNGTTRTLWVYLPGNTR